MVYFTKLRCTFAVEVFHVICVLFGSVYIIEWVLSISVDLVLNRCQMSYVYVYIYVCYYSNYSFVYFTG